MRAHKKGREKKKRRCRETWRKVEIEIEIKREEKLKDGYALNEGRIVVSAL